MKKGTAPPDEPVLFALPLIFPYKVQDRISSQRVYMQNKLLLLGFNVTAVTLWAELFSAVTGL